MSEIVFCRTRHDYSPYADFFRLAALSGFDVIYVDQMDIHDASKVYVVTPLNGEWMHGWKDPKATIIHWDLEWRLNGTYPVTPGVAEVWASDAWYAAKVGARHVPLGSHVGLAGHETRINGAAPIWVQQAVTHSNLQYDVCVMMYRGPYRRAKLLHELELQGLRIAPDAWGYDRDQILRTSKAMVHIHQHDNVNTLAPLRFAIAAAYKLPMITETIWNMAPMSYANLLVCDYKNLPRFTAEWVLRNETFILRRYGDDLHRLLCVDMPFRKCVEGAL